VPSRHHRHSFDDLGKRDAGFFRKPKHGLRRVETGIITMREAALFDFALREGNPQTRGESAQSAELGVSRAGRM